MAAYTTSVFASTDPAVYKSGVPRGIPKVKWLPLAGVMGAPIGVAASDQGEGVFRADKRSRAFSSELPGVDFATRPKSDDYMKHVGPGKYGAPDKPTEQLSYVANTKQRRFYMSNAEQYEGTLPTYEFDLDEEDSRNWGLTEGSHSFDSYPDRPSPAFKTPCNTEFYETEDASKNLDAYLTDCSNVFESKAPQQSPPPRRIATDIDPFHMSAIGPGMYGIPRDPNAEWGKSDADASQPAFADFNYTSQRSRSRLSIMEESMKSMLASSSPESESPAMKKARAAAAHKDGPGMYYSAELVANTGAVSPERTKPNESTRGTAGFVGSGRKDTKLEKDVKKWRANIPTAHFTHEKEGRRWLRGKGAQTITRGSMAARTSRFDQVSDKPRSMSPSISLKRIKEAHRKSRAFAKSTGLRERSGGDLRHGKSVANSSRRESGAARRSRSENSFLPASGQTVGYWPTEMLRSRSQASPEEYSAMLRSKMDSATNTEEGASSRPGFSPFSTTDWDVDIGVAQHEFEVQASRPTTPSSTGA